MKVSNKAVSIGCAVVVLSSIVHLESRIGQVEQKVDDIIQVSEPVAQQVKYTQADIDCLTKNIYYEAGVESKKGKYAVAQVTVNRVKAGKWGNNVCKVVYAPKQFSWTNKNVPKPNKQLWSESQAVAVDVLKNGARVRGLDKSLFYHATYIKQPKWVDSGTHAMTIGQHKFYNGAKNTNVYI